MGDSAIRPNILGELRAEKDRVMLDRAFYDSHDYRTLLESADRNLVVGRRGVGKSALVYKLAKEWERLERTRVLTLVPEEDQIASLRRIFQSFGNEFGRIRAAAKIAWKYTLLLECAESMHFYKEQKVEQTNVLREHQHRWRQTFGGMTSKLREALLRVIDTSKPEEDRLGFLGIVDERTKSYVFCHDGKSPDRPMSASDRILVHPCYWMALNLDKNMLRPEEAQEIFDEYDIEVSSDTPEIRKANLGRLMSELDKIALGPDGAMQFEEWVLKAIRVVLAGGLNNIALHPNGTAVQRRDVVGSNSANRGIWKRVLEDYEARQVIFEVKNFQELGQTEYRQLASYLTGPYGRIGFVVTRDVDFSPRKGRELDWIRELYMSHTPRVLVVKLTGKYLSNLLSKLRSPQRHDAADRALNGLLDMYERNYLSLPSTIVRKRQK